MIEPSSKNSSGLRFEIARSVQPDGSVTERMVTIVEPVNSNALYAGTLRFTWGKA